MNVEKLGYGDEKAKKKQKKTLFYGSGEKFQRALEKSVLLLAKIKLQAQQMWPIN